MLVRDVILKKLQNAFGVGTVVNVKNVSEQHYGHDNYGQESHFQVTVRTEKYTNTDILGHQMVHDVLREEFQKVHSIQIFFEKP